MSEDNSNNNSYEAEERRLMRNIRLTVDSLAKSASTDKKFIDSFISFLKILVNFGDIDYIPADVEADVSKIVTDLSSKISNSSNQSRVMDAYHEFEEELESLKEEERERRAAGVRGLIELEQMMKKANATNEVPITTIHEAPYEVRNPMGAKLAVTVKPTGKFWNKTNNSSNNERRSRNRKRINRKRTRRNTRK